MLLCQSALPAKGKETQNCKTRLPGFDELGVDADAATTLHDFLALITLRLP